MTSRSSRPVRLVVGGVIVVNLFVLALTAGVLAESREYRRQAAGAVLQTVARVLEAQLSGFFRTAELSLLAAADHIALTGVQAIDGDDAALDALLARQDARLPEALGHRVIDAKGVVRHAVSSIATPAADLSDRPYFSRLRNAPDAGPIISGPFAGRVSGRWSYYVLRRIDGPDGAFAGIVQLSLPVEHLEHMFSTTTLPEMSVGLVNDNLRFVARYPVAVETATVATGALSTALHEVVATERETAAYQAISAIDGKERQFATQKVGKYPLYLVVGLPTRVIFADWRREAGILALLNALFLATTSAGAWAFAGAWRARAATIAGLERAGAAAEEARRRSELILNSAGDGIYGIDHDGRCIFANSAGTAMLGWTIEEFIGRDQHALTHYRRADGHDYPVEDCPIRMTGRDGKVREVADEVFWHRDGSPVPVEYTVTPILEANAPVGSVVVFRNITERKAVEDALARQRAELRRSNQELEQFAYAASHDLREPLRMITSYLGLVERRYRPLLDDDGREFIHFAVDGAQRMDRLIRDLLEYSRVGRMGGDPEPVDLGEAAAEALANLTAMVEQAGAQVTIGALPVFTGRRADLVRLLQNLIGNAVKYRSPDRPAQVTVTARRQGPAWEIAVADNGIGIPEGDHERIFGIFQRLHGHEIEGNGIGLAMCKKIAEQHGGAIMVDSIPGQGSTFRVTLPAKGN